MSLKQTPSQTIGPFFSYGLTPEQSNYPNLSSLSSNSLLTDSTIGEEIRLEGKIFDGAGDIVSDAMIEIWQADAEGCYPDQQSSGKSNSSFAGFGRCDTGVDRQNKYIFETIKPGQIDTETAPHINVTIFMRGLLLHLFTRIYFSDEIRSNSTDTVLSAVPVERQKTLIARKVAGVIPATYVFDVFLQGENETVFFDI